MWREVLGYYSLNWKINNNWIKTANYQIVSFPTLFYDANSSPVILFLASQHDKKKIEAISIRQELRKS